MSPYARLIKNMSIRMAHAERCADEYASAVPVSMTAHFARAIAMHMNHKHQFKAPPPLLESDDVFETQLARVLEQIGKAEGYEDPVRAALRALLERCERELADPADVAEVLRAREVLASGG